MRYCGISEHFHDAGISFITEQGDIEFATHAERYSKIKLDQRLDYNLLKMIKSDDHITFYEDYDLRLKYNPETMRLKENRIYYDSMNFDNMVEHHISHAAGGYYTRPWESKQDTVMLTIDGAGEFKTYTIYDYNFNLLHQEIIPKSIGWFYAFTTRILNLKPLSDEYVVMGLSSYGNPVVGEKICEYYDTVKEQNKVKLKRHNLRNDTLKFLHQLYKGLPQEDIAASVQYFAEKKILEKAKLARQYGSKLIYSGGVAQNVVANSLIKPLFDDMWIPVAPTDAGSSLGCAAYSYGQITGKDHINWQHPYLGYDIKREINPKEVVDHLLSHTYCGIANGKAEFGPRALGNRSLIADVRYDVKNTVNKIKHRQEYRPFAPAILEEFADQYFEGPMNEYMQYTAKALHDYKSVTHIDGTARVQIVKKDCKSIFRSIIEEYYERTGIPMLLNTSLNIRGMPMVNDEKDATAWEKEYKVKIF